MTEGRNVNGLLDVAGQAEKGGSHGVFEPLCELGHVFARLIFLFRGRPRTTNE